MIFFFLGGGIILSYDISWFNLNLYYIRSYFYFTFFFNIFKIFYQTLNTFYLDRICLHILYLHMQKNVISHQSD